MAIEIHQNDTTQFVVTITNDNGPVNIAFATITQLKFQKPGGNTSFTVNANFLTDGTDGNLQYTTASGDLDIPGLYKLQGYVQIGPSGWKSDVHTFKVCRNL